MLPTLAILKLNNNIHLLIPFRINIRIFNQKKNKKNIEISIRINKKYSDTLNSNSISQVCASVNSYF